MLCDSQKAALSDSFSNVQIIEQKQEKKNLIPIFSFFHWVPFPKDTVTLTHTPYSFPRSVHVSRFLRVHLLQFYSLYQTETDKTQKLLMAL